jgi:hypothetical protein
VVRGIAIGGTCGILWGVVAAAVFTAMRAHLLPAPSEVPLPVALALVLAYLPFNAAVALEVLLGRGAPSFAEIMGVTIACGPVMGVAVSWLIALTRRGHQRQRSRN